MKPIILTFTRHYLPGQRAGGPIRTIANLVERLGDEFEFRIVAVDRDVGDTRPYPNVERGAWTRCGKGWVLYTSPRILRLRETAQAVASSSPQVIYLNGFFDPCLTQAVLVLRRLGRLPDVPIVIAPRGEMSAAALQISSWKKKAYMWLARKIKLYEGLNWQASSRFEARDIVKRLSIGRRGGLSGRIAVVSNIVVVPDIGLAGSDAASGRRGGQRPSGAPLRVCFLSRINPMKNLDFALGVLSRVRVPVQFSVYGPAEDAGYWAECQALIAGLPPHVSVRYEGAVRHADVVTTLASHDLFFLPTRGENFGHVIFEALLAGLPLLISDTTPWRQLEQKGIGWDLPLDDPSAFARRIEEVAGWSPADLERATARAVGFSKAVQADRTTIQANRALFHGVFSGSACASEGRAAMRG